MSSTWCCRVDERHQQTAALSKFCSSASASATLQSKSAPQAPQYSVALVLKRHLELSACAAATLQKILRGSTILWFWWLFCTLYDWLAASKIWIWWSSSQNSRSTPESSFSSLIILIGRWTAARGAVEQKNDFKTRTRKYTPRSRALSQLLY